ncbi:MAG: TonB family protein [Desulfomonilaceae bacterium]
MKKSIIAAIVLVATSALMATASETIAGLADRVVVDRSTHSKALNDYTLLTRDTIQRVWTTPTALNTPGNLKGRVGVNYTITRGGALESLHLVRSSGNPDMDRTLLEAIRSAAPFPPFPEEIAARRLVIRANFIVADVPTIPVTMVEHDVQKSKPLVDATPGKDVKKFIWGAPAGTAGVKTPRIENGFPPAPPQKKYRWGADIQPAND